MSSINYLICSYEIEVQEARKVATASTTAKVRSACKAELAKVEKLLAEMTERAHHPESTVLEKQSLIDDFQDQIAALKDEMDQAIASSSAVGVHLGALEAENKSLWEKLKASWDFVLSEYARLRVSWDKLAWDVEIGVREETTAKYATRLEIIRKYLNDRENLDQTILMLSQCQGILSNLRSFKEGEWRFTDEVLKMLAEDEAKFIVENKALDVEDLPPSVLYATPPNITLVRDMQHEIFAGVDQYGTISSLFFVVKLTFEHGFPFVGYL